MELSSSTIQYRPNYPIYSSSLRTSRGELLFNKTHPNILIFRSNYRPNLLSRKTQPIFRVYASVNPNGPEGSPWLRLSQAIRRGSERFVGKFGESVKKETGFDLEGVNVEVKGFTGRVREVAKMGQTEFESFKTQLLPEFIDWNKWDRWKVNFALVPHILVSSLDGSWGFVLNPSWAREFYLRFLASEIAQCWV